MMSTFDRLIENIDKFSQSMKDYISSIYTYIGALFLLILNDTTLSLYAWFISALLADYLTGTLASYYDLKKENKEHEFKVMSSRLRDSGVKILGYILILIGGWFISTYIVKNKISLFGFLHPLSVNQITVSVLAFIELYSNIENLERCGFNVFGKLKKVIRAFKDVKNEFNK